MDLTLRALADPSRREIISLLAGRAHTVSELLTHFRFSQPALSKHLRVLREAGLVAVEEDGRYRRYALIGAPLGEVASWVMHYHRFWNARLDSLGELLDQQAPPTPPPPSKPAKKRRRA